LQEAGGDGHCGAQGHRIPRKWRRRLQIRQLWSSLRLSMPATVTMGLGTLRRIGLSWHRMTYRMWRTKSMGGRGASIRPGLDFFHDCVLSPGGPCLPPELHFRSSGSIPFFAYCRPAASRLPTSLSFLLPVCPPFLSPTSDMHSRPVLVPTLATRISSKSQNSSL